MVKIVRQNYRNNHIKFNNIKKELIKILGKEIIISHVGSTAIPNISGKNIIDILIGIENEDLIPEITNILINNGYYPGKDKSKKYRFFASRKEETQSGDIHLHVAIVNTKRYNDFLLLKNYLLNNPNIAKEYSDYKKILVNNNLARNKYRNTKKEYVTKMINDARDYYINNYPKELIFIRHAENVFDNKIKNDNLPLSKKGIKQAYKAKEKLNKSFDIIISSPSKRSQQTAEIIGDKMKYSIDSRLYEKGYGNKNHDGKESYIATVERINSFLDDIKKYKNKRILIVTHGSLINLIKNIIEEKNIKRKHINNCYIIKYKIRDSK